MAESFKIVIEGPGAETSASELFSLEGVDGFYEVSEELRREGTVAVIGTIVGIAIGGITIGEKLHKWHKSYQTKDQQQRIEKVLIVTPTSRLLLEDASIEDITNILKPLAK